MVAVVEKVADAQVNAVTVALAVAEVSLFFLQANTIMAVATTAEALQMILRWFINYSLGLRMWFFNNYVAPL